MRLCFKELADVMMELASQKSVGQACIWDTQVGFGAPSVRQNSFSGKP